MLSGELNETPLGNQIEKALKLLLQRGNCSIFDAEISLDDPPRRGFPFSGYPSRRFRQVAILPCTPGDGGKVGAEGVSHYRLCVCKEAALPAEAQLVCFLLLFLDIASLPGVFERVKRIAQGLEEACPGSGAYLASQLRKKPGRALHSP